MNFSLVILQPAQSSPLAKERIQSDIKMIHQGTSLVVQWLGLHAPNAGGPGSIPGQGTRSHMRAATKEPTCRN